MAAALYKDNFALYKDKEEEMGKTVCMYSLPRKNQGTSSSFGLVFSHGKFLAADDSKQT